MKEKILAALKSKFSGVKEATLDRIATKKAGTVTDESQIQSIVDGVTIDTIIESESDYRASQEAKSASKKAITDYESKHKLKDGKPVEDPGQKKSDPDASKSKAKEGDDDVPAWAKSLSEKLDSYEERLSKQEKERERTSKLNQAKDLLKASKIPDKLKDKWIKRVDLEDEETSLENQVKALEEEYLELKQEHINESVNEGEGQQGGETTDADMKEFLDEKFPESVKTEK